MREIKVRVWHKRYKKMYYNVQDSYHSLGDISNDEHGYIGGYYHGFNDVLSDSDLIKMLYTTLRDKNGKEIYEWDIVKGIFYDGVREISPVIWHEKSGGFSFFGYPLNIHGLHDLEIVGNIYENPELLKEKS